jgi:hypothetical protein
MQRRSVLQAQGPSRLAKRTGILRAASPDSPTALAIESGTNTIPVVILAQHRINVDGALLADADGTPVAWEGERVVLVGGLAPPDDRRYPAFLASRVSVLTE